VRAVLYAQAHPDLTYFVAWRAVPLTGATVVALAVIISSRARWAQLAAIMTLLVVAHLGYAGWAIALV
jgi:hypothetical protein